MAGSNHRRFRSRCDDIVEDGPLLGTGILLRILCHRAQQRLGFGHTLDHTERVRRTSAPTSFEACVLHRFIWLIIAVTL